MIRPFKNSHRPFSDPVINSGETHVKWPKKLCKIATSAKRGKHTASFRYSMPATLAMVKSSTPWAEQGAKPSSNPDAYKLLTLVERLDDDAGAVQAVENALIRDTAAGSRPTLGYNRDIKLILSENCLIEKGTCHYSILSEQNRRRSQAWAEDFGKENRPRPAPGWGAEMGSCFGASSSGWGRGEESFVKRSKR